MPPEPARRRMAKRSAIRSPSRMPTSVGRRPPPIDDVTECGHGLDLLAGSFAMKHRMVNLVCERAAAARRQAVRALAIAGLLSCGQSSPAAPVEAAPVFVGELPGTDA